MTNRRNRCTEVPTWRNISINFQKTLRLTNPNLIFIWVSSKHFLKCTCLCFLKFWVQYIQYSIWNFCNSMKANKFVAALSHWCEGGIQCACMHVQLYIMYIWYILTHWMSEAHFKNDLSHITTCTCNSCIIILEYSLSQYRNYV